MGARRTFLEDKSWKRRRVNPCEGIRPSTPDRIGRRPMGKWSGSTGPCWRSGLPAAVPLQRRPQARLAAVGPPVQHAPRPHRPWRPATHQPHQQPPWLLHLGRWVTIGQAGQPVDVEFGSDGGCLGTRRRGGAMAPGRISLRLPSTRHGAARDWAERAGARSDRWDDRLAVYAGHGK
jgi:hypothetical protein